MIDLTTDSPLEGRIVTMDGITDDNDEPVRFAVVEGKSLHSVTKLERGRPVKVRYRGLYEMKLIPV